MYQHAEDSTETASPVTLYEFVTGESENEVYRYTDSDRDEVYMGYPFYRTAIVRSELQSDGTLSKATMTIKLPKTLPMPRLFAHYPPSTVVTVRIWETHHDDRDGQKLMVFSGRVLNTKNVDMEAELTCEPASTSVKRPALRRHYQKGCPLVLYGTGTGQCNAVKTQYGGGVSSAAGNTIAVVVGAGTASIAEQFSGGVIEWVDPTKNSKQIRAILSATGVGTILNCVLSGPVHNTPTDVVMYKGCAHTEAACSAWHNNVVNYGGQLWIPIDNPFGTTATFY